MFTLIYYTFYTVPTKVTDVIIDNTENNSSSKIDMTSTLR